MKNAAIIPLLFQIVTFLLVIVKSDPISLIAFVVANAIAAYHMGLTHKKSDELEKLKEDLDKVKSKVDGLSIAKGLGR